MIGFPQNFTRLFSPVDIINPLRFYCLTTLTWFFITVSYYFSDSPVVNFPDFNKFPVRKFFRKIPKFNGIRNIHLFDSFNSRYNFLRQTFFHNKYVLVTNKSTKKYNGPVYNLSVWKDESYITELGITHNCRCNAVQVRKSKFETSDAVDAITKAEKATTQIGKDGKNRLEIFRFNPGKDKVIFPAHHPYRKVQDADKVFKQASDEARLETIRMTFEKPIKEQFSTIYKSDKGGLVEVHELAGIGKDEYQAKIQAAKLFAEQGMNVKVLPARVGDVKYREKLYPNYPNNYKNPDFLIDGMYYDLKAIENVSRAVSNANKASKQDAIAIISNFRATDFTKKDLDRIGNRIISKNNKDYKFDEAWIVIDNTLYPFKRKRAT